MKRNSLKICTALLLIVCMLVFAGCGSKEPDPNAGVYQAYTAEMMGFKIGVDEAYPDGFSIELKDGGKCVITVGAESARGKWTLDGTALSVSGGGVELEGTLENSLMTFDDVMGSGMTMTFLLEGAEGPEYVSATDIVKAMQEAVDKAG